MEEATCPGDTNLCLLLGDGRLLAGVRARGEPEPKEQREVTSCLLRGSCASQGHTGPWQPEVILEEETVGSTERVS